MIEAQELLSRRFETIRDSRIGPVFFIEHGLDRPEREQLSTDVREALLLHPLTSERWDRCYLPLLVIATEVGYRYRGSGTDFWPVLEDELGHTLGAAERHRFRDLFLFAAGRYRGARPPRTAWADAFRLIVWPITHALVPLEFHRSLAQTLANVHRRVADIDDETLYRAIRVAASLPSARFATLLEDAQLVVAVARSLLADDTRELSPEIVGRLAADLDKDQLARRSVAVARTRQRATRTAADSSELVESPSAEAVLGSLQIRRTKGGLTLEASFPALDNATAWSVRRALRRRRFAPSLWGMSARVPSEQLLSGLPFPLRLTAIPEHEQPLFPNLDEAGLDAQCAAILHRYELRLGPSLVFAISADDDFGRLIRSTALSGHRKYWLLSTSASAAHRGVKNLGEVGPYRCFELDPNESVSAHILAGLGYSFRFGVSVRFAGAPTVDRDASASTFKCGDARVIVPQRALRSSISVEFAGVTVSAGADELVRLSVGGGDQAVRVSNDTESREFTFRGVPLASSRPAPLQIELRSIERTIQALLAGRMSFVVDALAPLDGLHLTVSLDAAEKTCSATGRVGPLPQVISAGHALLDCLLDEETRQVLASTSSAILRVEANKLSSVAWQLERQVRPCWWTSGTDGRPVLVGESGRLRSGVVSAAEPHLKPTEGMPEADEVRLLAPMSLDLEEFGASAMFTTFCLAPSRVNLNPPTFNRPRLLRRRLGLGAAVGLEDLMEGYLRWGLAETGTSISEFRRQQVTEHLDAWIVALCCGEIWALREASLAKSDPWSLLRSVCDETGIGRDGYIELSREQELLVTWLAVSEIRRVIPELWARVGPPSDLRPADYEALDLACARGYERLAEQCRLHGDIGTAEKLKDADPGNGPDEWNEVLERVTARTELRSLAELLLPTDKALGLMLLDVASMSIDDVSDELASWARSASTFKALSGASPTPDVLKAIYALWVEPEIALTMDWRGSLDTLIAERSVARAARYLALRARAARRGGDQ